jgi:enoyl-CoA hydratase/carnithine racemase
MSDLVRIERADGVQTIRFHRPEKKNALNSEMYTAATQALAAGDADPDVRVHLFAGVPGAFCAGNDIAEFLTGGAALAAPTVAFLRSLPTIRKPMVAAVDGVAYGIGTTLLFHCDLAYASPRARFRTPFLDLGLLPEAGSSLLGPRRLGSHRAFELLVLGEVWSAEQAERYGLINGVIPEDKIEDTARDTARRLAAKPPEALAVSRRLVRGDPAEVLARIDEEVALFAERLTSPEAKAAFERFLGR